MIIFTQPNDTPASIANRYLGYNDESKANAIRDANRNSVAWRMMSESGLYSANRALWFPIEGEDTSPEMQQLIAHEFDWVGADNRYYLAKAQQQGLNIHHALHAHQLNTLMNMTMSLSPAIDTVHSAVEIRVEAMKEFEKLLKQARTQLGNLADAETHALKQEARQAFGNTYREISTRYNNYFLRLNAEAKYQLKKPWKTVRMMEQQGWMIDDLFQAKQIANMVKYLRFGVIGGYVVMIAEGVHDTYETWEHTHSWEATLKEAMKVIADVGSVIMLTEFTIFALGLAGVSAPVWLTCLIAGGAAITAADLLDRFIVNPAIEDI